MNATTDRIMDLPESPRIVKRVVPAPPGQPPRAMKVTYARPVGRFDEHYGKIEHDGHAMWQACLVEGRKVRCRMPDFE